MKKVVSFMWNESDLILDVELTTHCNARCPQCSRTNQHNVSKRNSFVPLQQSSLEQFKKWLYY